MAGRQCRANRREQLHVAAVEAQRRPRLPMLGESGASGSAGMSSAHAARGEGSAPASTERRRRAVWSAATGPGAPAVGHSTPLLDHSRAVSSRLCCTRYPPSALSSSLSLCPSLVPPPNIHSRARCTHLGAPQLPQRWCSSTLGSPVSYFEDLDVLAIQRGCGRKEDASSPCKLSTDRTLWQLGHWRDSHMSRV
jgi:hypothetical protein